MLRCRTSDFGALELMLLSANCGVLSKAINTQVVWVGGGQAHGWISLSGITTHRNPKPRTTKYTAVAGGGGGSAISSYCPDGFYIDYWKVC